MSFSGFLQHFVLLPECQENIFHIFNGNEVATASENNSNKRFKLCCRK